jgi:hypothetical protein
MYSQSNHVLALVVVIIVVIIMGNKRRTVLDEPPLKHAVAVKHAMLAGATPEAAATVVTSKLVPADVKTPTTRLANWSGKLGDQLVTLGVHPDTSLQVAQAVMDHGAAQVVQTNHVASHPAALAAAGHPHAAHHATAAAAIGHPHSVHHPHAVHHETPTAAMFAMVGGAPKTAAHHSTAALAAGLAAVHPHALAAVHPHALAAVHPHAANHSLYLAAGGMSNGAHQGTDPSTMSNGNLMGTDPSTMF